MRSLLVLCLALAVSLSSAAWTVDEVQRDVEAKDFQAALAKIESVVREKPDSARAHYVYAQILDLNGQPNAALGELRTAARLDPTITFTTSEKFKSYEAKLNEKLRAAESAVLASTREAKDEGTSFWNIIFYCLGFALFVSMVRHWSRSKPQAVPSAAAAGRAPVGPAAHQSLSTNMNVVAPQSPVRRWVWRIFGANAALIAWLVYDRGDSYYPTNVELSVFSMLVLITTFGILIWPLFAANAARKQLHREGPLVPAVRRASVVPGSQVSPGMSAAARTGLAAVGGFAAGVATAGAFDSMRSSTAGNSSFAGSSGPLAAPDSMEASLLQPGMFDDTTTSASFKAASTTSADFDAGQDGDSSVDTLTRSSESQASDSSLPSGDAVDFGVGNEWNSASASPHDSESTTSDSSPGDDDSGVDFGDDD